MATSGRPVASASFASCGLIRACCSRPGVLDLDVGRVAPEDLDEPVEVGGGVLAGGSPRAPCETRPERQPERTTSPLRVPLEQLPVDARLVVVALEVAERGELDQVRVALVRLGEDGQVGVALLLPVAVVGDVDLAAHDRLDPLLPGLALELDRARERAVVGERDGRHSELGGPRSECRDAARTVEDRVLGVDVEMDEVGLGHWGLHSTRALGGLDFSARRCRSRTAVASTWPSTAASKLEPPVARAELRLRIEGVEREHVAVRLPRRRAGPAVAGRPEVVPALGRRRLALRERARGRGEAPGQPVREGVAPRVGIVEAERQLDRSRRAAPSKPSGGETSSPSQVYVAGIGSPSANAALVSSTRTVLPCGVLLP